MHSGAHIARPLTNISRQSKPDRQVEDFMIARTWEDQLAKDRKALEKDLREARIEGILDKDGLIAILVSGGIGTLAAGIAAGPIGAAIGFSLAAGRSWFFGKRRRADVLTSIGPPGCTPPSPG